MLAAPEQVRHPALEIVPAASDPGFALDVMAFTLADADRHDWPS